MLQVSRALSRDGYRVTKLLLSILLDMPVEILASRFAVENIVFLHHGLFLFWQRHFQSSSISASSYHNYPETNPWIVQSPFAADG